MKEAYPSSLPYRDLYHHYAPPHSTLPYPSFYLRCCGRDTGNICRATTAATFPRSLWMLPRHLLACLRSSSPSRAPRSTPTVTYHTTTTYWFILPLARYHHRLVTLPPFYATTHGPPPHLHPSHSSGLLRSVAVPTCCSVPAGGYRSTHRLHRKSHYHTTYGASCDSLPSYLRSLVFPTFTTILPYAFAASCGFVVAVVDFMILLYLICCSDSPPAYRVTLPVPFYVFVTFVLRVHRFTSTVDPAVVRSATRFTLPPVTLRYLPPSYHVLDTHTAVTRCYTGSFVHLRLRTHAAGLRCVFPRTPAFSFTPRFCRTFSPHVAQFVRLNLYYAFRFGWLVGWLPATVPFSHACRCWTALDLLPRYYTVRHALPPVLPPFFVTCLDTRLLVVVTFLLTVRSPACPRWASDALPFWFFMRICHCHLLPPHHHHFTVHTPVIYGYLPLDYLLPRHVSPTRAVSGHTFTYCVLRSRRTAHLPTTTAFGSRIPQFHTTHWVLSTAVPRAYRLLLYAFVYRFFAYARFAGSTTR